MNEKISGALRQKALLAACAGLFLFLACYNLTNYPLPWFDEGSHLHVPKTLVTYGVYADYSSEGFRYYGPTAGIGPTVFLPIAGAFELFGIGLLQARLVMVLYLVGAVVAFYQLARQLSGERFALAASAVLVTSRGIGLLEYGRQVLGEVPGLLFLVGGLLVWFASWQRPAWGRLALAGLLMGLSTVTKNQYLLVAAPALLLGWAANIFYYKAVPQRVFIVTGGITALCYAAWQVTMILYLGPATASENLALLQAGAAGAALVFSPELMLRGLGELVNYRVFLFLLVPAVIYGLLLARPKSQQGLRWGMIMALVVSNLGWYVLASISWNRYAFPGLVFSSLLVVKLVGDISQGFEWNPGALIRFLRGLRPFPARALLANLMLAWLAVLVLLPLGQNALNILRPAENYPAEMAAYMNAHVDPKALVETWEPEMGFLTNHNYHFPPPGLLYKAVSYIWMHQAPPADSYDFVQTTRPDYVLVGNFSSWVELYPANLLSANYTLETRIGGYALYARKRG